VSAGGASGYRDGSALPRAAAGFCATGDREPSQGRKAAALSGLAGVPQATWLLRSAAPSSCRCSRLVDRSLWAPLAPATPPLWATPAWPARSAAAWVGRRPVRYR